MAYAGDVATIRVSESMRAGLLGFEPLWKKRLRAWTLWSSQKGWRLVPYVFFAGAIILGLAVFKPWNLEILTDIVLSERLNPLRHEEAATKPAKPENKEGVSIVPINELVGTPSSPAPLAVAQPGPVAGAATTAPKTETSKNAPELSQEYAVPTSGKSKTFSPGRIGELDLGDFDNDLAAIREKVIALSGQPVGQRQVDRKVKEGEVSFSFALPESNLSELEEFLKTFGPVQFRSQRSSRLVPEGQIRIILTVKDGGSSDDKDEATAP